jgi:hypothetical protein
MNQTQLTGFGLIASACALAAALFINLQDKQLLPTAEAEMVVVTPQNLTFLTTRTQSNEESLFVIDNFNHKLLIYKLDPGRKRLDLAGSEDLKRIFEIK